MSEEVKFKRPPKIYDTDAKAAAAESAKKEDEAKRPWPTKAELSKCAVGYLDEEGRKYYSCSACTKKVSQAANNFADEQMEGLDKMKFEALWVALPPKTTLGGLPDETDELELVRSEDKQVRKARVAIVSSGMTSRTARGTAFIVVQWLL